MSVLGRAYESVTDLVGVNKRGHGDEVRKDNLDPKVREAIAEIADSGNRGKFIARDLASEVEARDAHAQGRPAAEAEAAKDGKYIGADIVNAVNTNKQPDLLEKQLSTIVASQGLTQKDVHNLVHQMKGGGESFKRLQESVLKGVDAAIDAPLKTPPTHDATVRQR